LYERQSTHDHFILGKSRGMIDAMMAAVSGIPIANVVDVGVYKGGSVVFRNEAFQPRRLVVIDLNPAEIPPLHEYCSLLDRRGASVSISA
jgi:hypothetical protein